MTALSRDFTVAVFVIHDDRVLLHRHRKLDLWLPPGGHIEQNELPDEAALREVEEESGLIVELVGPRGVEIDEPGAPQQLVRPEGIQLENIGPGHQHIDLIYFARFVASTPDSLPEVSEGMRWLTEEEFATIDLTNEVATWARKALRALRQGS
jgi:ADP-ribose pyrophosphatase YjhB (NUDIX family)